MAEIINRDEFEGEIAKLLGKQFSAELRDLMDALGDPPRIENLPPGYWDTTSAKLRGVVVPELRKVYLAQGEEMASAFSIQPDWGLVNSGAVEWAANYGFDLVQGITDTTRNGLSVALQAYYRDGLTLGQLEGLLEPYYGPVRAARIAVTEVTRAAVMGERGVSAEIMRENPNVILTPYHVTNSDDIVCPICGERDGKVIETDDQYAPLHPNCRCWCNHKMTVRKE